MAIVFGTSFQENLRRVYSSNSSTKDAAKTPDPKNRTFTEILTQLDEKSETKSPATAALSPSISNLTAAEKEAARLKDHHFIAHQPTKEPAVAMQFGVKAPDLAVKNLSPVSFVTDAVKPLPATTATPVVGSKADKPAFKVPPIYLPSGLPAAAGISPEALDEMINSVKPQTSKLTEPKNAPIAHGIEALKQMITVAGQEHGVDPLLGMAVAKAESSFRTNAVSSDGFYSKGMFQILDSTADDLLERHNLDEDYDPFNPQHSSHLGMGYLRKLLDIFSSPTAVTSSLTSVPAKSAADLEKLAVAAFNTGEGNVTRAQMLAKQFGHDPSEFDSVKPYLAKTTQAYVERVVEFKKTL